MGYIVRMPQMGMSMDEGMVVEWVASEGESVEEGDAIAVVESEKASNDVEAREDGVLRRILVAEGGVVEPGDPIGIFAGPDDDVSALEAEVDDAVFETADDVTEDATAVTNGPAANAARADESGGMSAGSAENVQATPGARKLADDEGVDLSGIDGSGPQGVIVEDDVQQRVASASASDSSDSSDSGGAAEGVQATPGARKLAAEHGVNLGDVEGTGPQGVVTDEDVEEHIESASEGATRTVAEARQLSGMQKTISDRLSESDRNAVHVTLNRSVDTSPLRDVQAAAEAAGVDVSITDLLVKAVGRTLATHQEFNATFEDGEHRLIEEINVGFAVDVEAGLVTPVIPGVADKTVEAVNEKRRELTDRALAGEFTMDDLAGGTFTVSNLGPFGVDNFDPIIDPPQVAILGVGRVDDAGEMTLSLSFDHRVVNGVDGAQFLDALVDTLTDRSTLAGFFAATVGSEGGLDARDVRVETDAGLSGRYRTAYGDVEFDEPESVGGSGTAPSPVDHLLGALGSCLSLSVRQMARRDDVDLGRITCDVTGSPEAGPLEAVTVELHLETDAGDEVVERIVTKAERSCYVARSLSADLDVSLDWEQA